MAPADCLRNPCVNGFDNGQISPVTDMNLYSLYWMLQSKTDIWMWHVDLCQVIFLNKDVIMYVNYSRLNWSVN